MKKHNLCPSRSAFSLVELIIVVSIIAIMTFIAISVSNNYTQRTKNTKVNSDVEAIKHSLNNYLSENSSLPPPWGNLKFFDNSSNYVHHDDSSAFWVYGNITENTLAKKYLDYIPLDPRINQYYAYGKTLSWNLVFQIAWVNQKDWVFEAKVVWNHVWDQIWPYNLIREYNWPDFVYDLSKNNFPYNPEEIVMRWKFWFISWSVSLNWSSISSENLSWVLLKSWDVIDVDVWSTAIIYFSDWSKSYLWDPSKASKLTIANMQYKWDNNLLTKIQLALDFWTIWTKTSKLDSASEFEIYTNNTEAAVRGTIFKVEKNDANISTNTNVEVLRWKVDIYRFTPVDNLVDAIKNNSLWVWANPTEVKEGNSSIPIPVNLIDDDWIDNIMLFIKSIKDWVVEIELPSSFKMDGKVAIKWDYDISKTYTTDKVIFDNSSDITNNCVYNNWILKVSWIEWKFNFKICTDLINQNNCTKWLSIDASLTYDRAQFRQEPEYILEQFDIEDCEKNKKGGYFWKDIWCVEQDYSLIESWFRLIAYAPYDTEWDLNMYLKNWNTVTYSSWWNISFDGSNTYNKWIKISAPNDWLAYSWSELNLWSDFAIEMSVKGEALKRTNWVQLFHSSNSFRGLISWNKLNFLIVSLTNSIYLPTSWFDSLYDNQFYPVIFAVNWTNMSMYISWTNYSTWKTITWSISSLWDKLYIWSSSIPSYRWDDLINYIKIYKK